MKMVDLLRYNLPLDIIELWQRQESDSLLPLQDLAVRRHNLFGSDNLLVQAPTSSGKTFIGEMAALHTALKRRQVVYLVPLKALAEEKYRAFRAKYAPYGLKVIISTRDRREFDADFEQGRFSIAVVVYEKLAQLLVRRPERIEGIALVIADELEILSDPERGAMAELLLTRLLQSRCRLLGLSAVIGDADKLAGWMKAGLLYNERRPVELRYGVLHQGRFRYRTYNEQTEGDEPLLDVGSDSRWEVLRENLAQLVEQGESCLLFVKSKQESRQGAEALAHRLDRAAANHAIEALKDLEPTRSRDRLLETLRHGVAFHNADLSPRERSAVEEAFRTGEIQVIVSTSTLAVGLNLPAQNVFLSPEKWCYDSRFGMPWKAPLLRAEYENMGGRAGRYGANHPFGRAILIATTPFDEETLWRRYVDGDREAIQPRLAHEPLENHILQLVASRCCRREEALVQFFEQTLTGQWIWQESLTLDEVALRVRMALNKTLDAGVVTKTAAGFLEATPLGKAIALKGISLDTAQELEQWLGESESRLWSDIDLVLAAALTPDGRMVNVSLTAQEYEHAGYVERLKREGNAASITSRVPLEQFHNCNQMPFFEKVKAIKTALLLAEWTAEAPVCHIEEEFHTMAGQILSAADQIAWIIDATAAIAAAMGAQPGFVDRITMLAQRIQYGVEEEVLPLVTGIGIDLPRSVIVDLHKNGLHTPETLAAVSPRQFDSSVSRSQVKTLQQWATAVVAASPATTVEPVLVVDDRTPGGVVLDGQHVALQEKQYRLIRALAAAPGHCVGYDAIYEALWGKEIVVESNQMHFQKRKLVERIQAAVPRRSGIVKTVPKRGFLLNLDEGEVVVRCAGATQAA